MRNNAPNINVLSLSSLHLGEVKMSSGELCFYGLGSFYLEYGGKRVDGNNWISKRAMYLLMYLALEWKRKVSVEELIDIFWPESEIEDGKTKLYNTIYLLRRSLAKDGVPKDIIESVTGCYTINKNYKIWTDWEYFEKEIDKQLKADEFEIEILKDLFILYRGDFFSNLKYEDWVDIYREELREYYLNLIEILTNKLFKEEKYRDTVNYLHKGIEYDPYRENFYLLYIKALIKLGRIAEAINSYKKCERILKEELDLLPGQELNNVYHRIKLSRDLTQQLQFNLENNKDLSSGAMICDFDIFEKIYELEIRQAKRLKKEFILMSVDFNGSKLPLAIEKAAEKMAAMLRCSDILSTGNDKIYLILLEMSLVNSGIVIQRFNQFCQELNLSKKPSIDITEIK